MIEISSVQNLVATWWFEYDQGNFDAFPRFFSADAHFSCRSDSGSTDFEEFVSADITGREDVVSWHIEHRRNSPYPLRHNGTNVHVVSSRPSEADFRAYIFVTQVVGGLISNLASGLCMGTVRSEEGALCFSDLRLVLDFTDSELFTTAVRHQPV